MRYIFILIMFGILLLQPGIGFAESYFECLTKCSTDKSSSDANCPPAGEEGRVQCLQVNQDAMKPCIDSCQQAARPATPAETPKDAPADTPKDTPDTPKDN
jgi:hypothetical protein